MGVRPYMGFINSRIHRHSLEVLALLVDVALVRALPRHVHSRPPALVQGYQEVGAGVPERQGGVSRHHLSLSRLPLHAVVASHRVESCGLAGEGKGAGGRDRRREKRGLKPEKTRSA